MAHSPLHRPHFLNRLGAEAGAPAQAVGSPRKRSLQALRLTLDGRPAEALAEANALVQQAPTSAAGHHARAMALGALGRVREAYVAAETAARLEPGQPLWRLQAGTLALRLAGTWTRRVRATEALRHAQAGLEADPRHAGCRHLKASALALLDQHDEAELAYRRTLALDLDRATRATVLADLGRLLSSQGRRDEAIERFEAALQLAPERVEIDTDLARTRQGTAEHATARRFSSWSLILPMALMLMGSTLAVRAAAGVPQAALSLMPLGLYALAATALAGWTRTPRLQATTRLLGLMASLAWLMASAGHLLQTTPDAAPLTLAAQVVGLAVVAGLTATLGQVLLGSQGRPALRAPHLEPGDESTVLA